MKMTEVKRVSLSNRTPMANQKDYESLQFCLQYTSSFGYHPSVTQDKSEDETEAGCQKVRAVVNVMGKAKSRIKPTKADKACLRVCVVCQQDLQDNNFACDDVAA